MHINKTQVPPSLPMTLLAASSCTLHFQALLSFGCENYNIKCHEKKLKFKRNSFTDCHSKGLVMKGNH